MGSTCRSSPDQPRSSSSTPLWRTDGRSSPKPSASSPKLGVASSNGTSPQPRNPVCEDIALSCCVGRASASAGGFDRCGRGRGGWTMWVRGGRGASASATSCSISLGSYRPRCRLLLGAGTTAAAVVRIRGPPLSAHSLRTAASTCDCQRACSARMMSSSATSPARVEIVVGAAGPAPVAAVRPAPRSARAIATVCGSSLARRLA